MHKSLTITWRFEQNRNWSN